MNSDDVLAAYMRIRRLLSGHIEAAIDYGLQALDAFDRDLLLLDASFPSFYLASLNKVPEALAVARAETARDRAYFQSRECKLERVITQLQLATDVRSQIFKLGKIRDAAAHGQRLAGEFDIPALVAHIRDIDALAQAASR